MGVPTEWAKGTLRLTTGRMTTAQEVDRAAAVIVAAVQDIRRPQNDIKDETSEPKAFKITEFRISPYAAI